MGQVSRTLYEGTDENVKSYPSGEECQLLV